MTKPTPRERQILDALRDYHDPQQVATLLGANLAWVQRLAQQLAASSDREGPHSMAQKLGSPYGAYWAEWQAAHPEEQRAPVRRAPLGAPQPRWRMVPDDRADEAIDFESYFEAHVAAIAAEAERGEGRGAA